MRACFGSMVDEFQPLRRCPSARSFQHCTPDLPESRLAARNGLGVGATRRGCTRRSAARRMARAEGTLVASRCKSAQDINVESSRTPAVSNYLARRAATKMWASRPRQTALKIQCRWSGHGAGSAVSNGDARVERGVAPWANISNGVLLEDCEHTTRVNQ